MPRNGSGTYTLPAGNPVEAGTVIESNWANTTLEDIANEITDSLSRSGEGGMLAPFRLADGAQATPGISWLNETSSGFYRAGSGEFWASVLGARVFQFTVNGVLVPTGKTLTVQGNATVGGTLGVTGVLTATGGVVGNVTGNCSGTAGNVSGTVAVGNGGTGVTTVPGNGQVLIGNGTNYTVANITAGTGIGISNGAGSLTISAASAAGLPTLVVVSGTTQTAAPGFNYALTNASVSTVTLPASPTAGDIVWVTSANGRRDNVVDRNGNNINGAAANLTLTDANVQLQYINSSYGWANITPVDGLPKMQIVSGTSQTAVANNHYVLTNASATTLTLPASPYAGDVVWVTAANGRVDNVVARNGLKINGLSENMTIDNAYAGVQLRYADSTRGWVFT